MECGDLAEFGKKNAAQMMIFLPIENVGRKITRRSLSTRILSTTLLLRKKSRFTPGSSPQPTDWQADTNGAKRSGFLAEFVKKTQVRW